MEIREHRAGDVLVLAPDGSIAGIEETSAIDAKLVASLKEGARFLVLDCSAIGHLTSAAIRVLLLTSRKLERTSGRLVLCGMSAKLTQAFSISGFDKDFTIVATREEALQHALEPVPRSVAAPPEDPPAAADTHDVIATALLEALGCSTSGPVTSSARTTRANLESLANGLLAALRVG
jgi:anti-anti-sigma factor